MLQSNVWACNRQQHIVLLQNSSLQQLMGVLVDEGKPLTIEAAVTVQCFSFYGGLATTKSHLPASLCMSL